MRLKALITGLVVAMIPVIGEAADWRYGVGVHDFNVPDVDSHTYGLNASLSVDERTQSDLHLFGSVDLFVDNDKDHLDPDHIPIWWQLNAGADGDVWRDDRLRLGWMTDFNTRMNTVSSVERQMTALAAMAAGYEGDIFQYSLEAGPGWFFLEIDDDAPRERGYDREGLRNSTLAYALTNKAAIKLGDDWTLSGLARRWWDGHQTLESQYRAELRGNIDHWLRRDPAKRTQLVLGADVYHYNLTPYNESNLPSVVGWDNDVLVRLSLETRW
ncbi:hypothetical protein [Aeromonas sp. MR16]|uniref:hypothetical protein n=1 Tax=Aeromonas sp. MR16 TaxID=2923420 RepID=UPI001F4ABAEE|nr:hypothetical protein [Aeromonas sp. MR16]MCH7373159.1 hypothetical protein [Aeromonas sp. MR16]